MAVKIIVISFSQPKVRETERKTLLVLIKLIHNTVS